MNIQFIRTGAIAALLVAVWFASSATAATVSISPVGDGAYELRGTGIEAAAGFEMTILYDPATLSNPRVAAQDGLAAGALMAVNANVPGSIRMALVRTAPFDVSGAIATITFDRPGAATGKITSLNARLADTAGRTMPVSVQVNNPSSAADAVPPAQTTNPSSDPMPFAPGIILPAHQAGGRTAQDEVSKAGEEHQARENPSKTNRPPAEPLITAKRTDRRSPSVPETTGRDIYSIKSVLQRFREFRGKPSVRAYLALFEQNEAAGIRQDPPVGLTDGRTNVRVSFLSVPGDRRSSDVGLMGGRLVSMNRDPEHTNAWIVAVEPAKNVYAASLTVSQDKYMMVYPLTVAPAVDIDLNRSGTVTEDDFTLFLRERGTPKLPKFDLNRDGKRDHVDDYIFTANYAASRHYLSRSSRGAVPAASRSSRSKLSDARGAPRD